MFRTTAPLVIAALSLSAPCANAQEPVKPSLLPEASIPPLVIGQKAPRSFVVNGAILQGKGNGIAFQLATDGKRRRLTLYDATDGTPI
jgi:hypothetical protein